MISSKRRVTAIKRALLRVKVATQQLRYNPPFFNTIVCEDLTKNFKSRNLGKNTNRRLSSWVKGLMASAFEIVASRRGSRVVLVNAAYTSQTSFRSEAEINLFSVWLLR